MNDYKICVEIDIKKIAVVGIMVLCVFLACVCGEGETLLFIVPACVGSLFHKK